MGFRQEIGEVISQIENNINRFNTKKELLQVIYPLLEYELYVNIKFKRLPLCVLPNGIDHFENKKSSRKIKSLKCGICKFNSICNGYYKEMERFVEPVLDLPSEIIIELTDKCNQNCYYCFNKFEYQLGKRNKRSEMSNSEIKNLLRKIKDFGVNYVRFSGGEPLLRKDVFDLMKYATGIGLEVWLNTNGTLVDEENAKKIEKFVSNVLIPINGYDEKSDEKVTRLKGSFKKRINAFKLLQGVKIRRGGVVLTEINVQNLERFYQIAKENKINFLEFYRPIILNMKKKSYLKTAIDKIYRLNKKYGKNYKIANSLPFCFYKPRITSKIALGSIFDDGHVRMVISSNGDAKPSYYFKKILGNVMEKSLFELWNDEFMLNLRNLGFLPKECNDCRYKLTCRGGARALAYLMGNESGKDPLLFKEN